MTGELAVDVKMMTFEGGGDNAMEEPFDPSPYYQGMKYIDMNLVTSDGVLHLCGKNDWGYLIADALIPLLKYANEVERKIREEYQKAGNVDVIGLGKNEFRAFDILHRLRECGEPITVYKGVPVVKLNKDNGIQIYTRKETEELPFK